MNRCVIIVKRPMPERERTAARRKKIARWALRKLAEGNERLAGGFSPDQVIELLVDEDPSLIESDNNGTPLQKIRAEIERERALG